MIEKLIKNYGNLCDSWIDEISIRKETEDSVEKVVIYVGINCANLNDNYKYEKLVLVFNDVMEFVIKDDYSFINLTPKEVFIKSYNGKIVFDFDAIDNFDYLEENKDSNFKIISKEFVFKNK